jgi:2',3'-cyclic-nucleotide 2'-phosphodiesterase (5'-nucleotidase family)
MTLTRDLKKIVLPLLLFAGTVASCHKPYYIQQHKEQLYTVEKNAPADSSLVRMLAPYKAGVDTQMQVVIGSTDIPLSKAQPECTLGNFMTDAQLEAAKRLDANVVASVVNYGSLRINYISPGPITRGKIYELMPFDNMLAIVEMPGSVLHQLCDLMAARKGWPVSGLQFTIKDKKAENILVDGEPLNEHLVYKIALNDYLARGGDNCDFLAPMKKRYTSIFVRDILIQYVAALQKEHKELHPVLDKRIVYAE